MSLPSSVRVRYEELRLRDHSEILANYISVGDPFEHPIRLIKVSNFTDSNLIISFDGITDHDVVGANSYSLYDYGSNRSDQGGYLEMSIGDRFMIKAEDALPNQGKVYVTAFYVSQA